MIDNRQNTETPLILRKNVHLHPPPSKQGLGNLLQGKGIAHRRMQ